MIRPGPDVPVAPASGSVLVLVVCALAVVQLLPATLEAQEPAASAVPDSTLRVLEFLTGQWRIPPGDSLLERRPELAGMLVIDAEWAVGGKAIRYREQVFPESDRGAELEGLIYWDPAREQIRFTAVAGHDDGQGRLLVGEFTPLDDGRIEKVYDVYYRTLADMPGEELGGARRRFREVLEPTGADRFTHSLEWWHEGRWQRWARGHYELVRARGTATGSDEPDLVIRLEHGSEAEALMARQLDSLRLKYDVEPWVMTRVVRIDERSIPHSHPVLTLHTRHIGDEAMLLATFVHEQLHWLEEARPDAWSAAMRELRELFPEVPASSEGGARDEESTYRHLLVCDMEYQAVTALVGPERARETLARITHYEWIYHQVLNEPRLRQASLQHGFDVREGVERR